MHNDIRNKNKNSSATKYESRDREIKKIEEEKKPNKLINNKNKRGKTEWSKKDEAKESEKIDKYM